MKLVELRHLDEVKGNFGMHDGKYYRADGSCNRRKASSISYRK